MEAHKLKVLNISRRVGVFNCLFNNRYETSALTRDASMNNYLEKERDKLEIILKNMLNGICVDSLLSSPENQCTSKINDIIIEIEFLLET